MAAKPGESDPEYLWARHRSLLASRNNPLAAVLDQFPDPLDPGQRSAAIEKLGRLTAAQPTLLVIDDYHFLEDSRYAAFFSRIVKAGLAGLSFLILSRSRPNLPLEEMRLKGQCRVFGRETLAFSRSEAEAFLAALGLDNAEFVQRAWRDSEGWPAALRLAAEGCRPGGPAASEAEFHHLFEQAVFAGRSQAERTLLMKLSIWEDFGEEEVLAVCREPRDLGLLKSLAADDLFLTFEPKSGRYRYHNLFRSFCRAKLSAAPEDLIDRARLDRRAARWLLEHGRADEAARFRPPDGARGPARERPRFTPREKQIIELVRQGLNNRQIAERLAVQRVTVTKALGNVYRKLGVKNRTQAIGVLLSG
jgi:LuxR family maltose regulon positive regulatory protein